MVDLPSPKQNRARKSAPNRPRWLYAVGSIALLCFILGFTPGGEAMWAIDIWLASWVATVLLLRRFGLKGLTKVILLALLAFILLSFLVI